MSDVHDFPPPYDAIVFDCDSTLSEIEGIDELGREKRDEIAELTDRAMSGEIPLEEVYGKRLELVKPTRAEVEAVGTLYIERAMPNARALIAALHALEKRVYIVSGGVLPAVRAIAKHFEVPDERTHAVDLFFDESGEYAGFDQESPLAANGGKPLVLRSFEESNLALIGDGVSDLEAWPETRRFVGFGGMGAREAVFSKARVTCAHPDFAELLPLLCSPDEIDRLGAMAEHAPLVESSRERTRREA